MAWCRHGIEYLSAFTRHTCFTFRLAQDVVDRFLKTSTKQIAACCQRIAIANCRPYSSFCGLGVPWYSRSCVSSDTSNTKPTEAMPYPESDIGGAQWKDMALRYGLLALVDQDLVGQ
jgi:hypothetical protein